MDIKIPHLQIAHQGGNLEVENIKIHRMINFKIVNGRLIDQAENSLLHTRLAEEELKCRKLTIYSVRFKAFRFFFATRPFGTSDIFERDSTINICQFFWPQLQNHIPYALFSQIWISLGRWWPQCICTQRLVFVRWAYIFLIQCLLQVGLYFVFMDLLGPLHRGWRDTEAFFAFAHQQQYSQTKLGQVADVGVRSPRQSKMTYRWT